MDDHSRILKFKKNQNKIRVFITVDTEHSIGGAFYKPNLSPIGNDKRIYCKINGKDYGIPLIMDILDAYQLKATFFLEVLNKYYFGEEESREVCQYIIKRGHDPQLHIHPNYQNFKKESWVNLDEKSKFSDLMANYNLNDQIELIAEGKDLLTKYGVERPIAFRAGCFGADFNTLAALKENGFIFDSSYNINALGKTCFLINGRKYNDLSEMNSMIECPITNFLDFKFLNYLRFKPLDISGVSYYEMKSVLDKASTLGLKHVVFILHSFSLIKSKDVQYNRMAPNAIVINRFKKLCNFLKINSHRFEVLSFADFYKKGYHKNNDIENTNTEVFPYVGIASAMQRKIVQVLNRVI